MSKRKRRVFSREFKLSAVRRIIAGERTAEVSRELGVPSGHMYQWCVNFSPRRSRGVAAGVAPAARQQGGHAGRPFDPSGRPNRAERLKQKPGTVFPPRAQSAQFVSFNFTNNLICAIGSTVNARSWASIFAQ
jgi:transposase-like protein